MQDLYHQPTTPKHGCPRIKTHTTTCSRRQYGDPPRQAPDPNDRFFSYAGDRIDEQRLDPSQQVVRLRDVDRNIYDRTQDVVDEDSDTSDPRTHLIAIQYVRQQGDGDPIQCNSCRCTPDRFGLFVNVF